jgi:hypothetical protein
MADVEISGETISSAIYYNNVVVTNFLINHYQDKNGALTNRDWCEFVAESLSVEMFKYLTSRVNKDKFIERFNLLDYMLKAINREQIFKAVIDYFAEHEHIDLIIEQATINSINTNGYRSIEISRKYDKNYSTHLEIYIHVAIRRGSKYTEIFIDDIFTNKNIQILVSGLETCIVVLSERLEFFGTLNDSPSNRIKEIALYIIANISKILLSGVLNVLNVGDTRFHINNVLNFAKKDEMKYSRIISYLNELIVL